ncbi:MAG: DUF4446 family protein [bacterium]
MFPSPTIIGFIAIGIFAICMLVWNIKLERRIKKVFKTEKHESIDDVIEHLINHGQFLAEKNTALEQYASMIDERLKKRVLSSEVVRFNAWGDASGGQSFAMALIDEEGNGIILSSLYARDRMSVFAKPVKAWKSEYELTEEEKSVLFAKK